MIRSSRWITVACGCALAASMPFVIGTSCSGSNDVIPITPTVDTSTITGTGSALFRFTAPTTDLLVEQGDNISISWNVLAIDKTSITYSIWLAPLDAQGAFVQNGEIPLTEDIPGSQDDGIGSLNIDSGNLPFSGTVLPFGTYRAIAKIRDASNVVSNVVAPGKVEVVEPGLQPSDTPPVVVVLEPRTNLSVEQGGGVPISWCASDRNASTVIAEQPDLIITLDTDDDPENDLGTLTQSLLTTVCSTVATRPYPVVVNQHAVAYVIACLKVSSSAGCADLTANTTIFPPAGTYTIDKAEIPPQTGGQPYLVRITAWDRVNAPVHNYAPGTVNVTTRASSQDVLDLAEVGRTITGARFQGFDSGGFAGSAATGVGDVNGDGVDDFVIVSRWGRPFDALNAGSAHLIFGQNGRSFGGDISLNSVTTLYDGTVFWLPGSAAGQGLASVSRVSDVDGDGLPEILFGAPFIEGLFDPHDDDPCDCPAPEWELTDNGYEIKARTACYNDGLPNPWSEDCSGYSTGIATLHVGPVCLGAQDYIGSTDHREFIDNDPLTGINYNPPPAGPPLNNPLFQLGSCSNDGDMSAKPPINGGYAFLVSSQNFTAGIVGLGDMGVGRRGARFRGPWLDDISNGIVPDNGFGATVNTMPAITNTAPGTSARFGGSLVISAPQSRQGRGMVFLAFQQDFTSLADNLKPGDTNSLPLVAPGNCSCPRPSRRLVLPDSYYFYGANLGDELGGAAGAGDYNLDGSQDILMGAPGADPNGLTDAGIGYIMFGRPDFPGVTDLAVKNPPRMEIHGSTPGMRLGSRQSVVGDVNVDGVPDVAFATETSLGLNGETNAGMVAVVYGGRPLTGENIFSVNQIGGQQLPGFTIFGTKAGHRAGRQLLNAGDFNGDGVEDLMILAPGEERTVNGTKRKGVAYLIYGGLHLNAGGPFTLDQVGTSVLPGQIFVSPYQEGTADDAPISFIAPAGDVNNDGFDDILIGVEQADYVNPLAPTQRRIDAGECFLIYGSNARTN